MNATAKLKCLLCGVALSLPMLATGQSSDDAITIVSPREGQVVASGAVLPVVVEIDEAVNAAEVIIVPSFSSGELYSRPVPPPYRTEFKVPEKYYGWALLEVYVASEPGGFPRAKKFAQFKVLPTSPVEAVFATDSSVLLYLPPHPGSTAPLSVYAALANQHQVNVETAEIPVTFEAHDTSVATVSKEGVISAVDQGQAWVTIHHGDLTAWVAVTVLDPVTRAMGPPVDISSKVSILSTGVREDAETGHVVEQIRVINTSAGPLHRPFVVVVDGLPERVRVYAPDGRTRHVTPIGAPYMLLPLYDSGHFMPGDSATVEFTYFNAGGRPITRNYRVFNGSGP